MRSGNYTFRDRPYTAHWFFNNQYMGSGSVAQTHIKGKSCIPFSYVRVCPECGDAWSQVVVEHPDTKFIPESRLCPKHGAGYLGTYETEYELPRDVMRYDILQYTPEAGYESFLITGGN